MKLAFDHIIHVVEDLNNAVRKFNECGFHTVEGGSHVQFGTYNALSYFGLSYVELLGIENYDIAKQITSNELIPQTLGLMKDGGGFARIAIRTTNIEQLAEQMRNNGFDIIGPLPGSRKREDGSVLNWNYLFPKSTEGHLALPFFIQWEDTDENRLKDLIKHQFIKPSTKRMKYVGFAVQDAEKTATKWSQLLGIDYRENEDKIYGHYKEIFLAGGSLRFYSDNQSNKIQQALKQHGESPFLVAISGCETKKDFQIYNGLYTLM